MVSNTTSLQMVNLGLGTTLTLVERHSSNYTSAPAAQSTDYSLHNEASTQSVSSNQQSSNTNVEAVSAPKLLHTRFNFIIFIASTGGSVKAQFLANGGTEALGTQS